jgi:hypothetical protein
VTVLTWVHCVSLDTTVSDCYYIAVINMQPTATCKMVSFLDKELTFE